MVKEKNEVYKCSICGNIVEVNVVGGGTLVCCGQEMKLQEIKTSEAGTEKHLPMVEIVEDKIIVKVGSVAHPMQEDHYIQWIELLGEHEILRHELFPGQNPQTEFPKIDKPLSVRIYCNLHELWETKIQ